MGEVPALWARDPRAHGRSVFSSAHVSAQHWKAETGRFRELWASQFSRNKSTRSLCSLLFSMWLSHTHFIWSPYHPPPCPPLPDSAFPPPAFSLCTVISPVCYHLPLRQHVTTAPLWFLEVCQARHTSLKVRARTYMWERTRSISLGLSYLRMIFPVSYI